MTFPFTQFRNRKVVHYEEYFNYIIIVTQREPKLFRQNIHNDAVTVAYLVDNAKAEINPFVI